MLLKQADKLVKEGNYEAALEVIAQARLLDPENAYAEAYEDRVRALLNAKVKEQQENPKEMKEKHGAPALSPVLEQISSLAIQEEERHFMHLAANREPEKQDTAANNSLRLNEDVRKAAIVAKIGSYLARASELSSRNEFSRALDEISRAYLLDANNAEIVQLEQTIRLKQEQAEKANEAGKVQQAKAAEQRREETLRVEVQKVHQEQEERKRKEEEARKQAHQEKVLEYLSTARALLEQGRLEQAQTELSFITVLDASNKEAVALSREIQEAVKSRREEEARRARKAEEEERQKLEAIQVAVQKHLEQARDLSTQGDYAEALKVITRAYVLDPMNSELQQYEEEVLAAQDESQRLKEAKRREEAEAQRRKEEEELSQIKAAELEKLLQEKNKEAELHRRSEQEQIEEHLGKAREHLRTNRYDKALAEVAAAFLVNPFDEATRALEQQIRREQPTGEDDTPGELPFSQADLGASVESHRVQAERFRDEGDFQRALDDITKAFALDPLNESIQRLSDEILEQFLEHREHGAGKHERTERSSVAEHLKRASDFLDKGDPGSAMREINTGLEIDGGNKDLLGLHGRTTAALHNSGSTQPKSNGRAPGSSNGKASHRERAHLFFGAGQYDEALAEIALALALDGDNGEMKNLEKRIWEEKERHNNDRSDSTSTPETASLSNETLERHLLAAEDLAMRCEYAKALDELAQAFLLDPLNESITVMEDKIREMESSQQNNAVKK